MRVALADLIATRHDWDHYGDLVSNILLYTPFGFFGVCAVGRRVLTITGAAALLATTIELAQFYDLGRISSLGDVYADTLGAGLGALAAAIAGAGLRWPLVGQLRDDPAATLVLLMWAAYRFYPYVPVSNWHKFVHALAPLVFAPSVPALQLARFIAAWLAVMAMLAALYGPRWAPVLFILVAGTELVGRIMIVGIRAQPADVLAITIAFVIWLLLAGKPRLRLIIVTVAFAVMVIVGRLQPFTFVAPSRAFGWVPFASFLHGSIGVAIQAFCEKFFQYGALIWLLRQLRVRLGMATLLVAAMMFAASWAETWLPGRTAQVTDAVMALLIGGAFALLRRAAGRPT